MLENAPNLPEDIKDAAPLQVDNLSSEFGRIQRKYSKIIEICFGNKELCSFSVIQGSYQKLEQLGVNPSQLEMALKLGCKWLELRQLVEIKSEYITYLDTVSLLKSEKVNDKEKTLFNDKINSTIFAAMSLAGAYMVSQQLENTNINDLPNAIYFGLASINYFYYSCLNNTSKELNKLKKTANLITDSKLV